MNRQPAEIAETRERMYRLSRIWLGTMIGLLIGMALASYLPRLFRADEVIGTAPKLIVLFGGGTLVFLTAVAGGVCGCYITGTSVVSSGVSMPAESITPFILDTSAVIDGRIVDVQATGVLNGPLVVPEVVVTELQALADSPDRLRRARGRRGLDLLDKLRTAADNQFSIWRGQLDAATAVAPVDLQLVAIARQLNGKLVTGDFNLGKVARLQGVPVVNLNDVAAALRPVFLPGDSIEVELLKPGESPQQGVGYLEDGTMVVVDGGRERIGQTVHAAVTSVLQTSAGRMIFARWTD
ncbi:MAG: TRAM domain-containing protein [Planctomycetes bacterium]|nr:TRAM domain-containing protein [Planctomycetota bacterium]